MRFDIICNFICHSERSEESQRFFTPLRSVQNDMELILSNVDFGKSTYDVDIEV